ncbi:MAG: T9SS type A sorting domain-containing protein [Chlorobi bacterium]|nr:T9SS type A sorting domain-containing protein [Chlorobiota bacterium]
MKIKATKLFLIILFFIGNSTLFSQNDSFTLLGRWAEGTAGTVAVKDDIAFIGNGSNLTLVDISVAENPVEISSYLFSNIVTSIALSDHYAYVVGSSLLLHIIDFSDPNNLVEVGSGEISSYVNQKILFSNNFVYIQMMRLGLKIIDVSDPTSPVDAGTILAPSILNFFVDGNYAYIPAGLDGMYIYDVSDPANPTLESVIENDYVPQCVTVNNNYAYMGEGGNLRIFDVADKTNPVEISSVESYFKQAVLDDGFIYATEEYGSLSIINVTDPHNPTVTASLPYGTIRGAISIAINGDNLLVADLYHGLRILDVSNQTDPAEISLFRTGNSISDVVVKDNFIYTSDIYNGLYILQHQNKSDITCISKLVPESEINVYYCLELQGNYAYLGSEYGMYIIDISDPSNPFIINEIATQRISKIEVDGEYAYLLFVDGTFSILDISDQLNPVEVATLDDLVYRFSAQNDKIYIVFSESGTKLSVVDISDAYNPEVISDVGFENLSVVRDISVNGNYVYAVGGHNLNVIDISDAENPSLVGKYSGDGSEDWRSISVSGEDAYVCNRENLTTINIGDPANPLEAEKYNTPNTPFGAPATLFVEGTTAYFAQSEIGLLILENNFPTGVDFDLLPSKFSLEQNYPNPFSKGASGNSITTIEYSVPVIDANFASVTANVTLKVYDVLGREVATLVNKEQTPGNYSVQFNAAGLSSGIYFYKLNAGSFRSVKKMILLK